MGRQLAPLKVAAREVKGVASLARKARAKVKATRKRAKKLRVGTSQWTRRSQTKGRFARDTSSGNAPCQLTNAHVDVRMVRNAITHTSNAPGQRLAHRRLPHLMTSLNPKKAKRTKRKKEREDEAAAGGNVRKHHNKGKPRLLSLLLWRPSAVASASIRHPHR